MKSVFSKCTAVFVCFLMLTAMIPALTPVAFAAVAGGKFENAELDVVSDKKSTLAPGVTQDAYTVYDKNGEQVKMFVATADMNVDTVKLFASYKDMNPTEFGMSKLTQQVAAFNEKAAAGDTYYNGTVVAGINASYYNMTTGQPTGVFVMNGVVGNASESAGYFAVMNDGSVKMGVKGDYVKDEGKIKEAIGIYTMLIVDGEICSGLNDSQKYPRQTIGITADGKVITMSADGNQAPSSVGLTVQEQAEVMQDLGCVWAGHLDGGGSMTYGSRPEGSNEFKIVNSPSDGSERSISNGFIIVSTAAASDEFSKVKMTVEDDYVAPGVSTNVTATGVSSSGSSAEIPEGVEYSATNGTIVDGVYTAGTVEGTDSIVATLDGKTVGSVDINVVTPDGISFKQAEMTVPYGKTVKLGVKATTNSGKNEVKINEDTVEFAFDNEIGTVNGFNFTAPNIEDIKDVTDPAQTSAVCTVTVKGTEVSATANITLGKGSEVISDFNDGEKGSWQTQQQLNFNYYFPGNNVSVKDGALRVEVDYSNSLESGYMCTGLGTSETYVIENGLALGFRIFIPEETEGLRLRMCFYDENNARKTADLLPIGKVSTLEKGAWYYVKADISAYPVAKILKDKVWLEFYVNDRDDLTNYGYNHLEYDSLNTKLAFYIDDITVDYSAAVDDREAPVFTNPTYASENSSDGSILSNNSIINGSTIDFAVNAEDFDATNAEGIDAETAKVYIDGNKVSASYKNGKITASRTLSNGKHHIKFEIADKNGNIAVLTRSFVVNGVRNEAVKIVAHDETQQDVLFGSIYDVDVVAAGIENVQSVEVDLDLNNMNKWELDHMKVAEGFKATYKVSEDNNVATVKITRAGNVSLTGEAALVSLPIRVYEMPIKPSDSEGAASAVGTVFTYASFKKVGSKGESWPISVNVEVDKGLVTYTDNTTDFFSGNDVKVMTESKWWHNDSSAGSDYLAWNGGHDHRASTKEYYASSLTNHVDAVALEDKSPTCTEDGYKNRTYCEVCNSVVDWGTTAPATGHEYEFVDGVLKCTSCENPFNGEWEDGKTYVDGVLIADGWVDDSYYKNGVKLTGVQLVGDLYYDFGKAGICVDRIKYTGLFYDKEISAWRYAKLGELTSGWQQIDDHWHYFHSGGKAVPGTYKVGKAKFTFNEQGMTKGAWYTNESGTRFYYGPSYYRAYNPGYMKFVEIDGNTYNFDYDGYLTPGTWALRDSTALYKRVFKFAKDGSLLNEIKEPGAVACEDAIYFINDEGIVPLNSNGTGIMKDGDDYYYVLPSGKVARNATRYVTAKLSNGFISPGEYTFDADGKMEKPYTGIKTVDGVDYYYLNGIVDRTGSAHLVKIGEDIYYVTPLGKIKKEFTIYISASKANGLVIPGEYTFGADGKMEKPYTGIKTVDGVDYYYLNGIVDRTGSAHLVKVGEDIYYVTPLGKIKKDFTMYISASKANGVVAPGEYTFGADGKMVVPYTGIKTVDGVDYYYLNGVVDRTGSAHLVKIGEDIYYVTPLGKIKKDFTMYISASKANGVVAPGEHTFGADGKMVK